MKAFPLTSAFVKVIEDTAHQKSAKLISRIYIKAGSGVCFEGNTSGYLKDMLRGTAARDADIYISHGSSAGRCRCCGLVFADEEKANCPECGCESDSIPLDGRLIIDMIEIEV